MMWPNCPVCHKEWNGYNRCSDCIVYHNSDDIEHIIRSYDDIKYSLMWYADGRCFLWSHGFGLISTVISFPYDITKEKLEKLLLLL